MRSRSSYAARMMIDLIVISHVPATAVAEAEEAAREAASRRASPSEASSAIAAARAAALAACLLATEVEEVVELLELLLLRRCAGLAIGRCGSDGRCGDETVLRLAALRTGFSAAVVAAVVALGLDEVAVAREAAAAAAAAERLEPTTSRCAKSATSSRLSRLKELEASSAKSKWLGTWRPRLGCIMSCTPPPLSCMMRVCVSGRRYA